MKTTNASPSESGVRTETFPALKPAPIKLYKILVPTDFSECSRRALSYALAFAQQFKAELVILHVVEPPPPQIQVMDNTFLELSPRDDLSGELEQWRQSVSEAVPTTALLRDGVSAHKHIVAVAREVNADMIVIGNHGRGALGRALMGSTAEKVVRYAPCPTLVIRQHEHDFIPTPE